MGWLTTASAPDQVASQPSSGLPMISSTGGQSWISSWACPAHAHPARLGLAVQHHHLDLTGVKQPEQGRFGSNLNNLGFRDIRCRTAADGKADPGPDVRIVAVNDDLHGLDATDTGGRAALAYVVS